MGPRKLDKLRAALAATLAAGTLACGSGGQAGSPDGSGGGAIDAGQADGSGAATCDMNGVWVVAQVVYAQALGANQKTVNWFYHDITQSPDGSFTINKSLNCGFRVSGTVTVTLKDSGLEALATHGLNSVGRQGTFKLSTDGTMCQLDLNRTYGIIAADPAAYVSDLWVPGDPDKDLSTFPPLPTDGASGMQDWDNDGMDGLTLVAGALGERYVAQRDWNEHHGLVPAGATQFGGDGVIVVDWDNQESVSPETTPLLRVSSTPMPPGYAWYAKVDDQLTVVTTGDHPELETCKNVQRLALQIWPDP